MSLVTLTLTYSWCEGESRIQG